MKEIKQVIAYGAMVIASMIGFIGSMLIVSLSEDEAFNVLVWIFGIGMLSLFIFSIVMLYMQIDEGEKDIIREELHKKED